VSAPAPHHPAGGPAGAPAGARIRRGVVFAAALAAALGGLLQLVWHFRIFLARAGFPLDLEWMEGGTLLHARRLAAGQTVYVEPSVDFVPFFYTPLYPAVVALLSKVLPEGYLLARAVSIASFAGALVLLGAAAARQVEWTSRPARAAAVGIGLGGAGVVAAGFAFAGAFYDLVRADSLLLALEALALYLAYVGRSWKSAAFAGLAIALAFFTKQTASIIGVCVGLGLLVASWRRGLVYGVAAAVPLALGLWLLNVTSDGWFWRYVFEGHQSHEFRWRLAFVETPPRILRHAWPLYTALVLATVGLALARRLRREDAIVWLTALGGTAAALVGFGTQWAFDNAFIPAIYFPAFAAAALGGRLAVHGAESNRGGAVAVAALSAVALAAAALRVGPPDFDRWVPGSRDRAAAGRLIETLRALPGELFIPFHPYYAVLVGKRPYVHRMGVWDVASFYGRPRGLDEAIATGRFDHVVLDWKSQPWEWPGIDAQYRPVHELREGEDSVRMFSGAETSPRTLLARSRPAPPLPPGGRRLFDFEGPGWGGFSAQGEAFGPGPAPAGDGLFGAGAADSGRAGPAATGTLRSPPFRLTGTRLRLVLRGPADPGLRVLLLDGPAAPRSASPAGGAAQAVEWDVAELAGREVVLQIEDRSAAAGVAVDEVVELGVAP
jgi:hypothetical protein